VRNVRRGSLVEVNIVDPFVRKGYRFKGPATVHERGTDVCTAGLERMREAGSALVDRVRAIVLIEVAQAVAVISPAYDDGAISEPEMVKIFQSRFARLHPPTSPAT
jgi:uncharacterized protein